ncbi:MAG: hypothetical protein JNL08_19070 [Planctomycetes bacterium]|nr:hypothetical protein [Planctomycetota bacterium]
MHSQHFAIGALAVAVLLIGPTHAQCSNPWLASFGSAQPDQGVVAMTHWDPDGTGPAPRRLVIGGYFLNVGAMPANRVAAWDAASQSWSAVGTGISSFLATVTAFATLPNGDLVAAGDFSIAGGVAAVDVARWNGTAWSALGSGSNSVVYALATLPNGHLVAGGLFTTMGGVSASSIARWNGTTWSAMGSGLSSASGVSNVGAMRVLPNGDLVVGGGFEDAGGVATENLARWNGTTWSAFGPATGGAVNAMVVLRNGDLVIGGSFTSVGGVPANRIAYWNGATWSALGAGMNDTVTSLTLLPNGDVVAGGTFTTAGGTPANHVARWNGSSWSAFGPGTGFFVLALETLANGDVAVGGVFTSAGGTGISHFARLTTTCPATAVPAGLGCPSSGGSNSLVATTLPWVATTFQATGTGLPANALVVTATSFTQIPQGAEPLLGVFPQAGPGCDALVRPDILGVVSTTTGTAQSSFFLPNVPPLVGLTFYHQMVPIEIGPQGDWIAITATNALALTAGMF